MHRSWRRDVTATFRPCERVLRRQCHGIGFLVQLDRGRGPLEVVALRQLLAGLVDGVVHFLQVERGGDVERIRSGHPFIVAQALRAGDCAKNARDPDLALQTAVLD